MKQFIKQYALALVAILTILSFSAFKANGVDILHPRMTVALYFHGDPTIQSQVENEALWTTTPNGQTCNNVNHKACMILVEHTDLNMSGALDPAKITLGSVDSGAGFRPTKTGGSSSTTILSINRA